MEDYDGIQERQDTSRKLPTGWLLFFIGIVYGYMTPGKQDKMDILKKGAIIGVILGIVLGIVGLILGLTAKGDIRRRGLTNMGHAKWGVILSGIGIALSVAMMVTNAIIIAS